MLIECESSIVKKKRVDNRNSRNNDDELTRRQRNIILGKPLHDELRTNRNRFQKIDQQWDWENPCIYCNCIYLTTTKQRKACCLNSYALIDTEYPCLQPLPKQLKNCILKFSAHMSKNSANYNRILSIASTK